MLKASVIIPTYNRPSDLAKCMESVLGQTVRPAEILVIDDGDLGEVPFQEQCAKAQIDYIYYKKDVPGLTESRNVGVSLAKGDVLFFFDDDVFLMPDYLEKILPLYEADPALGGAGGFILNTTPMDLPHRIRRIYDRLFLNSGVREGKVLASGFPVSFGTTAHPIREVSEVDFLPGCAMSYRREIFGEFQFTPRFNSYGFGEDKDFSYQVSRKYRLVIQPAAKLYHYETPVMRDNKELRGRKYVTGRYLFMKKHLRPRWWNWILFAYAMGGYTLFRMVSAVLSRELAEFQRVKGIFGALGDIFRGKIAS